MTLARPSSLLLLALPALLALLAPLACDKPDAPADKPAPSAQPSASASPPPAPTPSAPPAPAPTASAAPSSAAPTKDVVASVVDPATEHERTVKALSGGTVALYLPEWAGTTWKVTQPDKSLGKPKEETIPGFAGPTTPAHAFTWQIKDAPKGLHRVPLTNTAKGRPPAGDTSFTLSIDVT